MPAALGSLAALTPSPPSSPQPRPAGASPPTFTWTTATSPHLRAPPWSSLPCGSRAGTLPCAQAPHTAPDSLWLGPLPAAPVTELKYRCSLLCPSFCTQSVSSSVVCPSLCNPRDRSPPGSSIHGILQARILEWVAISSSRGLPKPRIEPESLQLLHWQAGSLPTEPPGKLLHLPQFFGLEMLCTHKTQVLGASFMKTESKRCTQGGQTAGVLATPVPTPWGALCTIHTAGLCVCVRVCSCMCVAIHQCVCFPARQRQEHHAQRVIPQTHDFANTHRGKKESRAQKVQWAGDTNQRGRYLRMPAEQSRRGLGPQGNWAEWVRAETGPKVQKPTLGALTVSFRGSELKARLQLVPEWPWSAIYRAGKGLHFLTCRVGLEMPALHDWGSQARSRAALCKPSSSLQKSRC